jgi:hypothetical protein
MQNKAGWLDGWIARWRNSKTALIYLSCIFVSIRGQTLLFITVFSATVNLPEVHQTIGVVGRQRDGVYAPVKNPAATRRPCIVR